MRTFLMFLVVAASLSACKTPSIAHSLLAAEDRPVCMGDGIDQACVDQNLQESQEWNACVSGCELDCPSDWSSNECRIFCEGGGTPQPCGLEPDPEDCRVDVVVDPEVSECASVGEVKNCSKTISDGLGTITYEYPKPCNETLDSTWQCGPCNFQNPQTDQLGSTRFTCTGPPEVTWTEDCIKQINGDVLMRP